MDSPSVFLEQEGILCLVEIPSEQNDKSRDPLVPANFTSFQDQ